MSECQEPCAGFPVSKRYNKSGTGTKKRGKEQNINLEYVTPTLKRDIWHGGCDGNLSNQQQSWENWKTPIIHHLSADRKYGNIKKMMRWQIQKGQKRLLLIPCVQLPCDTYWSRMLWMPKVWIIAKAIFKKCKKHYQALSGSGRSPTVKDCWRSGNLTLRCCLLLHRFVCFPGRSWEDISVSLSVLY